VKELENNIIRVQEKKVDHSPSHIENLSNSSSQQKPQN